MGADKDTTVNVTNNSSFSVSVLGESSSSSELQVTPNRAQTIPAGGSASFKIKAKKAGVYTVTFRSSCATKVLPVVII